MGQFQQVAGGVSPPGKSVFGTLRHIAHLRAFASAQVLLIVTLVAGGFPLLANLLGLFQTDVDFFVAFRRSNVV